jgi:hypothetical protein
MGVDMGGAAAVERDLLAPGDHDVDSTVVCVLTRFGLRRPWHMLRTYIAYRWLLRRVRQKPSAGFLHATFLVENPTTCYSLSLWADEAAIAGFGTSVAEHVDVARSVFGQLRFDSGMPEIWSTKWRLCRVSRNLNWSGFDLRSVVQPPAQEQNQGK